MKTSNQLKALVRNLSKAKNVEAEVITREPNSRAVRGIMSAFQRCGRYALRLLGDTYPPLSYA